MVKKLTWDLSVNNDSDIIYNTHYKFEANESSVLIKWSGATVIGGTFKIYGYLDHTDEDSSFLYDTVNIEAENNEIMIWSEFNIDAIKIVFETDTDVVGSANVFVKMTGLS